MGNGNSVSVASCWLLCCFCVWCIRNCVFVGLLMMRVLIFFYLRLILLEMTIKKLLFFLKFESLFLQVWHC